MRETSPNIRKPPQSLEAEQSLLGGLMLRPGLLPKVSEIISPEDFYRPAHRLTFETIIELDSIGITPDVVTVTETMMRDHADKIENGAYLTMLVGETPGPANAMGYAQIVREKSQLRQLIEIGSEIVDSAFDGRKPAEVVESSSRLILDQTQTRGSTKLDEIAIEYLKGWEERRGQKSKAVRPLLVDGDKISGPWMPSDFVVLAARPSMGKTAGALQVAIKAAFMGIPVEFLSLEMSREQLLTRACHHLSGVDLPRDPDDWKQEHHQALSKAMHQIKSLPLYVDDSPDLDPVRLRWKVRSAAHSRGVRLVIIDYLQLMQPAQRGQGLYETVTESSRACKGSAKGSGVVVLALSQLSRQIEQRNNKRPNMADLRESGQIEQDADQVIFLHSDAYYKGERSDRDLVEWIWAKNRHGQVGEALTVWRPDLQRFYDADPSIYQELAEKRQEAKSGPY